MVVWPYIGYIHLLQTKILYKKNMKMLKNLKLGVWIFSLLNNSLWRKESFSKFYDKLPEYVCVCLLQYK